MNMNLNKKKMIKTIIALILLYLFAGVCFAAELVKITDIKPVASNNKAIDKIINKMVQNTNIKYDGKGTINRIDIKGKQIVIDDVLRKLSSYVKCKANNIPIASNELRKGTLVGFKYFDKKAKQKKISEITVLK